MQKIKSAAGLREAILQLERKQAYEGKILKEQFHRANESIKPINLIISTFKEVAASRDLKNNIVNTSIGLTAGYLSKILFESVTKSPFKKLLSSALMFGITSIITKNPEAVKSLGKGFVKIIRRKSGNRVNGNGKCETS